MNKMWGPYLNNDGRYYVFIVNENNEYQKGMAYARYLVEQYIGYELSKGLEVDHIDRNKINDVLENLSVKEKSLHLLEDHKLVRKIKCNCVYCGKELERKAKDLRSKFTLGIAGPFCRSCSGKYGNDLRKGLIERFPPQSYVESEYYYIEKDVTMNVIRQKQLGLI